MNNESRIHLCTVSTFLSGPGGHTAPQYRVAVVNAAGDVLMTKKIEGTGWGEDDVWVRLSNGCVAFPYVWDKAPGGVYGNQGGLRRDGMKGWDGFSSEMKVTVLCEE